MIPSDSTPVVAYLSIFVRLLVSKFVYTNDKYVHETI